MLPFLVRHCACLITHYQVKSDGKTPYERLRGRPYQGQVAGFAEVVHFRDPGKADVQLAKNMVAHDFQIHKFHRQRVEA